MKDLVGQNETRRVLNELTTQGVPVNHIREVIHKWDSYEENLVLNKDKYPQDVYFQAVEEKNQARRDILTLIDQTNFTK